MLINLSKYKILKIVAIVPLKIRIGKFTLFPNTIVELKIFVSKIFLRKQIGLTRKPKDAFLP